MKHFIIKTKGVLALSLLFVLVSCGAQKPMVSDIKITPHYVGSDVLVSVSADLNIGNVTLPSLSLPLIIPKTGKEIGSLSMQTAIGGANQMFIDLNLSSIASVNAGTSYLPNGGVLPLIALNKVIEVPLKNNIKLYISFGEKIAAFGIAIPFKTLDGLGQKIGTSSLFPVFNINNIFGAAGIYTSKTQGLNGFGLFADLSSVLSPLDIFELQKTTNYGVLNLSSIKPTSKTENKINDELYKLHKKKKKLEF